jgi:hypothetical protein
MSSTEEEEEEKKQAAEAILQMLREAGVSTENLEGDRKHPFWDTQVSELLSRHTTTD